MGYYMGMERMEWQGSNFPTITLYGGLCSCFSVFFILYRKVQVWSKKWLTYLTLVNESTTPKLPELVLALINSQTLRTRLAQ